MEKLPISTNSSNLYYLGVARLVPSVVVISSFAAIPIVERDILELLQSVNIQFQTGQHYKISSSSSECHLMADDSSLLYFILTKKSFPLRIGVNCLEELQRNFVSKHGSKTNTAKSYQIKDEQLFSRIHKKYDQYDQIDALTSVQKKVEEVKTVMHENIVIALDNCVKLEKLEQDSEKLMMEAGVFRKNAKKLRDAMWWKNIRMKLFFLAIALTVLGVIIALCVVFTQQRS